MYPEIHYQIEESRQSGGARTATVFGCYGVSPEIYLPAQIHGVPVTKIGTMALQRQMRSAAFSFFCRKKREICPKNVDGFAGSL